MKFASVRLVTEQFEAVLDFYKNLSQIEPVRLADGFAEVRFDGVVLAISAQQLEYEIHSNALQVLDFDLPRTSRTIGITQREESHPSPGAVVLMDAIREVATQMERRAANSGHW